MTVFTDLCLRLAQDFLYRTNANKIDLEVWKDLLNEVMNQISSLFGFDNKRNICSLKISTIFGRQER